ncbi:putative secreted esterase [Legionella gratiana]|uniref:Secreted esterase n=1 Tax=Legionella gratiana TaxID=45066 RepID=A0A378J868_9GAMM|nr:serine hydrolase [Legionella gratiana]KTD11798.1 putative secreted esterase [Legionella gratiana]STX40730.1 putative secreted esterase [Legionella gratiana]
MKEKIIKLATSLVDLSSLTSKPQSDVEKIRREAMISQVSVATVIGNGSPITHGYGDVAVDTVFGAASLSKPVFTYLVLKLIDAGKLSLDMNGLNNILPFKAFCEEHGFKWNNDEEINEEDISRINAFTPAMILSHKTGFDLSRTNQVNHQFEPGQEYYRYSGLPLFYLQKVIEKLHEPENLEVLAHKYVFDPLHMDHSSFGEQPCAANSLTTTAQDYALFVQAWMNDKKLQYAFNERIRMTQDPWAKETVSDQRDLNYVAECLGFQLELDEQGKPLTAFKTSDMGPWRGWVAIDLSDDLKERKATVYFAKGPDPDGNGHILAEALMKPNFQLDHGLRWFKEKYGFATGWEENWDVLQKVRCNRGMNYQEQSPTLPKSEQKVIEPIESTQKMFQLMPPTPKPTLKTMQSQEQEANSNQPIQEVEETRKDNETLEEREFNLTLSF